MIISFHNFYSIWKAFGEALGSFQEARRPTFGLKMEVRRQVPLVLRAIFQHQAPHHLSNAPPWSQNKLKIIPKFIPRLFRIEISAQSEAEILWISIQNRSNIHHTCMSGFNFSFSWLFRNVFIQRPRLRTLEIMRKPMICECVCTFGIFGIFLQLIDSSTNLVWKNLHFGIQTHQKSSFKRMKFISSLMIVSFHNFYSIWEAFGEALVSFQKARRLTFDLKMEVRR